MSQTSEQPRIDTAAKIIRAAPQTLYEAYLNPDALASWLPPDGMTGSVSIYEPHEGGTYEITLTYTDPYGSPGKTTEATDVIKGKFIQLVPNQKIVMSGLFESDDSQFDTELIETWYFEAVPEGTKVTLVIENVPPIISKKQHDAGLNSTLDNLARYVEK